MINETKANNPLQTASPAYIDTYEDQLTHRIVVSPKFRKDGRYWCTKAGPLFDARFQGEVICSSIQPLLDSARVLKSRGVKGTIEMWHEGSNYGSLTMAIEVASNLTIKEGDRFPSFVEYISFQGPAKNVEAATLPPYTELAAVALTGAQGIDSRIHL